MQEVNLYQLLKFYVAKLPWIVAFTILGALAGYAYTTYLQTPLYKSDATLLIIDDEGKATKDPTLINNYIELIKSRRVLEPVIEKSNHALNYDELAAATTATNEKDTEVIKVSVATKNAKTSKELAEGLVTSFQDEIKNIYDKDNVTVVDKANLPEVPFNVHQLVYLGLAASGGFFFAVIALFFAYDFKRTRQAMQEEAGKPIAEPRPKPVVPTQPKKAEHPEMPEDGETEDKNQLILPMPPVLDEQAAATKPGNQVSAEKPPQEKLSFARRTMRTLVGLTLEVPPRLAQKDEKKAD